MEYRVSLAHANDLKVLMPVEIQDTVFHFGMGAEVMKYLHGISFVVKSRILMKLSWIGQANSPRTARLEW